MKLTNYAILFFGLFIVYIYSSNARVTQAEDINLEIREIESTLNNATDAALNSLVETYDNRSVTLNKDRVVDVFYKTMYSGFGILSNTALQREYSLYVPVIIIVDEDGLYINYWQNFNTGSGVESKKVWSNKIPYDYTEGDKVITFSLVEDTKVYDSANNLWVSGDREYLHDIFPSSILFSADEMFEETKYNTIVNKVEKYLTYYANEHNKVANEYGIPYGFYFSANESTDWNQEIQDISIITLFQGLPYKSDQTETFNKVSLAVTQLKRSNGVVVSLNSVTGEHLYHKEGCSLIETEEEVFSTKEEAAIAGFFPCSKCKP